MIFNTSNTDMKYIFFFKCYVLRRYGFTLFGLKYKTQNSICYIIKKVCVWIPFIKLIETTSFININRNIFKIFKTVFNKKRRTVFKFTCVVDPWYHRFLLHNLFRISQLSNFFCSNNSFLNFCVCPLQSSMIKYCPSRVFCLYLFRKASWPLSLFTYCFFRNLFCVLFQWLCFCFLFLDFLIKFSC